MSVSPQHRRWKSWLKSGRSCTGAGDWGWWSATRPCADRRTRAASCGVTRSRALAHGAMGSEPAARACPAGSLRYHRRPDILLRRNRGSDRKWNQRRVQSPGARKVRKSPAQGESPGSAVESEPSPNGAAHAPHVSALQACAPFQSQSQGCRLGLATFAPLVLSDAARVPLSITPREQASRKSGVLLPAT